MTEQENCPKCLGSGEIMEAKKTKGFHYIECELCKSSGIVEAEIAKDFIFAMNEENFENDEQ